MVRNWAVWTVDHIHPDGSLTAPGHNGTIRLPATYGVENVELAYARTVMGAQGRNVQGGASYYERPTDVRNLYVAMTRGTTMNEAFIVANGEQTPSTSSPNPSPPTGSTSPPTPDDPNSETRKLHLPGLLDRRQLWELLEQRYDTRLHHRTRPNTPSNGHPPNGSKPNAPKQPPRRRSPRRLLRTASPKTSWRATTDRSTRKHATEITAARLEIERLPDDLKIADNELSVVVSQLEHLRQQEAQAKQNLRRRPEFETTIDAIDERLDTTCASERKSHDSNPRKRLPTPSATDQHPARLLGHGMSPPVDSPNTEGPSISPTASDAYRQHPNEAPMSRAGPSWRRAST